jgi:hypothetical protein
LSQRIIVMNRAAEQPFGTFAEGTLSAAAICDACGNETAWGRLFIEIMAIMEIRESAL